MTASLIFSTALDPPRSSNLTTSRDLTTRLRALHKVAAKHTVDAAIAKHQAEALRSLTDSTVTEFDTGHIASQARINVLRSVTTSKLTAPHFWDKAWRIIIDHDAPQPAQRFAICWAYKHILDANQTQPVENGHVVATDFADHLLAPIDRLQQLINDGTTEPQTLGQIFNAPLDVIHRQLESIDSRRSIHRPVKQSDKRCNQSAKETT